MIQRLSIEAPAKINLRLAILGREESGFHSLETLFCGLSLCDRLSFEPSESGFHLAVSGDVETGPPEHNLVVRAAESFYSALGLPPHVRCRLEKRIPAAAGLGGGSSDAAATLRALNLLHGEPFAPARLLALGAGIGSDVPFFLTGSPYALAWGRGERLLELEPLPARPILIAHPGVPLPTPAAFQRLDQLRTEAAVSPPVGIPPQAFPIIDLASWERVAEHASNDFEFVAFERIPTLVHALRTLIENGANIALLAGSGSAIFGVFPAGTDLTGVEQEVAKSGFATWRARTLEHWPRPAGRD
ncbi:MAG: 4-(cytidine 5'-diphospho)-2-C-methyl-D-erythritol kinase [Gemmatimonadota bacterium]